MGSTQQEDVVPDVNPSSTITTSSDTPTPPTTTTTTTTTSDTDTHNNTTQQFNPQLIINQANEQVKENDVAGAQMTYQSALLDWVDDIRELSASTESAESLFRMNEAVATLWIEYAKLVQRGHDGNGGENVVAETKEAFEAAVYCPVAGNVGRLWKEYALFLQQYDKHIAAQGVYLRALVGDAKATTTDEESDPDKLSPAVTNVQDQNELWNEFWIMMKKCNPSSMENLSLEEFRGAVEKEHNVEFDKTKQKRSFSPHPTQSQTLKNLVNKTSNTEKLLDGGTTVEDPVSKRMKLNHPIPMVSSPTPAMVGGGVMPMDTTSLAPSNSNKGSTTEPQIDAITKQLQVMTEKMPENITAEWLARDGDELPQRPEPPLFAPSPPKLGDPSGKDMLGTEMALKLIQLLLKGTDQEDESGEDTVMEDMEETKEDKVCHGTMVLEVCRACWIMTAMKEKEAAKSLKALDDQLSSDIEKLETELDARLSVAGAALSAVQQMNANEKNDLIMICNQKRQQLLALVSWEFRHLLAIQQQLLTHAGVPGFNGPTVDATSIREQADICSFLHSAFYLRQRIGEKQHCTMLKSQDTRLSSLPPELPTQTSTNIVDLTLTGQPQLYQQPYPAGNHIPVTQQIQFMSGQYR